MELEKFKKASKIVDQINAIKDVLKECDAAINISMKKPLEMSINIEPGIDIPIPGPLTGKILKYIRNYCQLKIEDLIEDLKAI
jgi:hypothetical protein